MNLEVRSRVRKGSNEKPALLFVHGGFHGAWCWDEFYLPFFFERGWDVHALSLRGHGASEGAHAIEQWTLADYSEDVRRSLETIGKPVVLIGHSMGGVIAQRVFNEDRTELAGMVLLASSPLRPDRSVVYRLFREHPLSMLLGQFTGNTARLRRAMIPFFFSPKLSPTTRERYVNQLSLESPRAIGEVFSRARPEPSANNQRPVLVIAGRDDWSIPLDAHRVFVEAYGAEFVVSPGYHDLMLDPDWEASATCIHQWLGRLEPV